MLLDMEKSKGPIFYWIIVPLLVYDYINLTYIFITKLHMLMILHETNGKFMRESPGNVPQNKKYKLIQTAYFDWVIHFQ